MTYSYASSSTPLPETVGAGSTMPGPNRDDLHAPTGSVSASSSSLSIGSSSSSLFNSPQPTKAAVQTGLAVLAFLLAIRFCLQRGAAWLRRSRSAAHTTAQPEHSPALSIRIDEKRTMQTRTLRYGGGNGGDIPAPIEQQQHQQQQRDEPDSSYIPAQAPSAVPERRQQKHFLTRLPPAPPLTPPELSATIFACDEDVDGFISQPNPDYMSATSSLPFQLAQPTPRRRSYMKTAPLAATAAGTEGSSSSATAAEQQQAFGPSSYPPANSPGLPPPSSPAAAAGPPAASYQEGSSAHEDGDAPLPRRNVDVKGEIISVVNEDGAGWTRHTRVYGGGVCLACAASGGHEGGFYGATVTPEEMRY